MRRQVLKWASLHKAYPPGLLLIPTIACLLEWPSDTFELVHFCFLERWLVLFLISFHSTNVPDPDIDYHVNFGDTHVFLSGRLRPVKKHSSPQIFYGASCGRCRRAHVKLKKQLRGF